MGVASDGWREATGMPSFRERLLERAVEAAENGIVIADARVEGYPILYSNPAFTRITGYDAREAQLGLAAVLGQEGAHEGALEQIAACMSDRSDCTIVLRGKRKNGSAFWSEFTVSPMPNLDGVITHLVGVQNDI